MPIARSAKKLSKRKPKKSSTNIRIGVLHRMPQIDFDSMIREYQINHERNQTEDRLKSTTNNNQTMPAQNSSNEPNVSFTLRTEAGNLRFEQSEHSSYTDFVRVAVQMLVAFNGEEIDRELKRALERALHTYDHHGSFLNEDDDDDQEERDFLQEHLRQQIELSQAIQQAKNDDEARKYVTNLPPSQNLTLRILAFDDSDQEQVENYLSKFTDLSPPVIHSVLREGQTFDLPADKAKELYVQLRILDVVLTIKTPNEMQNHPHTKKGVAAKSSGKKDKGTNDPELDNKVIPADIGVI